MREETHPRPGRPLSAPWLRFRLPDLLERLKQEPEWEGGKPRSITLLKQAGLNLVLMALPRGQVLHEHRAPGTISIHVLSGRIGLRIGDQHLELTSSELVTIDGGIAHEVQAIEESAFLLTLAKEPAAPVESAD